MLNMLIYHWFTIDLQFIDDLPPIAEASQFASTAINGAPRWLLDFTKAANSWSLGTKKLENCRFL